MPRGKLKNDGSAATAQGFLGEPDSTGTATASGQADVENATGGTQRSDNGESTSERGRRRKPRYGAAFWTLSDMMKAPEPTIDGAVVGLYTLSINEALGSKVRDIYVRATSYAQAQNAAHLLVFREPRKMTDKQTIEAMRSVFQTESPNVAED